MIREKLKEAAGGNETQRTKAISCHFSLEIENWAMCFVEVPCIYSYRASYCRAATTVNLSLTYYSVWDQVNMCICDMQILLDVLAYLHPSQREYSCVTTLILMIYVYVCV